MENIINWNNQFWKGVSEFIDSFSKPKETLLELEERGQQIEKQILEHYGIEGVDCYNVESHYCQKLKNYEYDDKLYNKKSYIHTISTKNNPEKPNLIFIHGYWSSSLSFIKCIKPLSQYFNVYLLDLPGQALSARVPFPYQHRQEMLDYFVNNLEEWRKNMFKDKKIYLAGHSFGGFLAGHYALQYEENLESLYMISPFGIYDDGDKPSVHNSVIYYTFQDYSQTSKQAIYYIFQKLWNLKFAVSDLYQKNLFNIGSLLLKNFLKQTLDHQKQEYQLFHDYYDVIMKLPVGSEKCMTTLLKFPSFTAFDPLEQKIQKLKIPVHFYYGNTDWMEKDTAFKLINNKKLNGTYNIIDNSSHNVQFENPKDLSNELIKQLIQNQQQQQNKQQHQHV